MRIEANQLLLLLNWMSPTFPIGSFAYSHGLEQAIADGLRSADDVQGWISDLLQSGTAWNDAVLFARCWNDDADELNDMARALCGSAERFQETTQLGRNFEMAASVWLNTTPPQTPIAYAVAAGRACARAGINKGEALLAFLQGFCAAQVSVAVRLVPLGQTKGLEILRDLAPVLAETAKRAAIAQRNDLGGNCILAEIAAMKHETLAARVFRT